MGIGDQDFGGEYATQQWLVLIFWWMVDNSRIDTTKSTK